MADHLGKTNNQQKFSFSKFRFSVISAEMLGLGEQELTSVIEFLNLLFRELENLRATVVTFEHKLRAPKYGELWLRTARELEVSLDQEQERWGETSKNLKMLSFGGLDAAWGWLDVCTSMVENHLRSLIHLSSEGQDWEIIDPLKFQLERTHARICSVRKELLLQLSGAAAYNMGNDQHTMDLLRKVQLRSALEGIPDSFRRWVWEATPKVRRKEAVARKWHIEHEYHVQSLIYTVLKPFFADLKEESILPKTGETQTRADLHIIPLRTTIEIKYWYQKHPVSKLIDELAADAGYYLARHSGVDEVIPVIWDEGRRTEVHGQIRSSLRDLRGMADPIIICRPSIWGNPNELPQ
jgi:hypothetical protein